MTIEPIVLLIAFVLLLFFLLLPVLVGGFSSPGLVAHKTPYWDVDFKTLKDARYQIRSCILKELVDDARRHFDKYRGFFFIPDPWYSYTCDIPSHIEDAWDTWIYYQRALEVSLRETYPDPFLHPRCNGGYWPAMGGLVDLTCAWRLPVGWAWNTTFRSHVPLR